MFYWPDLSVNAQLYNFPEHVMWQQANFRTYTICRGDNLVGPLAVENSVLREKKKKCLTENAVKCKTYHIGDDFER